MDENRLRSAAHRAADWALDYRKSLADRPVSPNVKPGDIGVQIPSEPPENPENPDTMIDDFERLIVPGMVHWQHPRFFGYFPANAPPVTMISEFLVSALASNCMQWQTAPAAIELESVMLGWLRKAVDLPDQFSGSLQDSGSISTLIAVLAMREIALDWKGNEDGLSDGPRLRVYASVENHSSVDKAVRMAGIGQQNLVKIPTDARRSMDVFALKCAIDSDRKAGYVPAGVVVCVGGTSTGGIDDVEGVCKVSREEKLYTHVDAAWAGSAMICPEFRSLWRGVEYADSLVFNPHKWLGAPLECSAHFVKDRSILTRTLAMQPAYLKNWYGAEVSDPIDVSVSLGRRFRALKVWFLLRGYGLSGLREIIRSHVKWTQDLARSFVDHPDFQLTTSAVLSLLTFRLAPAGFSGNLDDLNEKLLQEINAAGEIQLTPARHDGNLVIRMSIGNFETQESDVQYAFSHIIQVARKITSRVL